MSRTRVRRVSALEAAVKIENSSRVIKKKTQPHYVGWASLFTHRDGIPHMTSATITGESKTSRTAAEISALMNACLLTLKKTLSEEDYMHVSRAYLEGGGSNPAQDLKCICAMIREAQPETVVLGQVSVLEIHPSGEVIPANLTIGESVFGTMFNNNNTGVN